MYNIYSQLCSVIYVLDYMSTVRLCTQCRTQNKIFLIILNNVQFIINES